MLKNNYCLRNSISTYTSMLPRLRLAFALFISCLLMACAITSYKPSEFGRFGFSESGCALLRQNGSFSKQSYLGRIDGYITPQNATGVFVARGTQVKIQKIESSWDFENGDRMRLYIRVPINGKLPTFYLEETRMDAVSKGNLDEFVNLALQPCGSLRSLRGGGN